MTIWWQLVSLFDDNLVTILIWTIDQEQRGQWERPTLPSLPLSHRRRRRSSSRHQPLLQVYHLILFGFESGWLCLFRVLPKFLELTEYFGRPMLKSFPQCSSKTGVASDSVPGWGVLHLAKDWRTARLHSSKVGYLNTLLPGYLVTWFLVTWLPGWGILHLALIEGLQGYTLPRWVTRRRADIWTFLYVCPNTVVVPELNRCLINCQFTLKWMNEVGCIYQGERRRGLHTEAPCWRWGDSYQGGDCHLLIHTLTNSYKDHKVNVSYNVRLSELQCKTPWVTM